MQLSIFIFLPNSIIALFFSITSWKLSKNQVLTSMKRYRLMISSVQGLYKTTVLSLFFVKFFTLVVSQLSYFFIFFIQFKVQRLFIGILRSSYSTSQSQLKKCRPLFIERTLDFATYDCKDHLATFADSRGSRYQHIFLQSGGRSESYLDQKKCFYAFSISLQALHLLIVRQQSLVPVSLPKLRYMKYSLLFFGPVYLKESHFISIIRITNWQYPPISLNRNAFSKIFLLSPISFYTFQGVQDIMYFLSQASLGKELNQFISQINASSYIQTSNSLICRLFFSSNPSSKLILEVIVDISSYISKSAGLGFYRTHPIFLLRSRDSRSSTSTLLRSSFWGYDNLSMRALVCCIELMVALYLGMSFRESSAHNFIALSLFIYFLRSMCLTVFDSMAQTTFNSYVHALKFYRAFGISANLFYSYSFHQQYSEQRPRASLAFEWRSEY